jgi:FKBP-type peptidyl-prolyl cis-trans isomerase (trigger factor)
VAITPVRLELTEAENCIAVRDTIQVKEEEFTKAMDNMLAAIESSVTCSVKYMTEDTESEMEVERRKSSKKWQEKSLARNDCSLHQI